MPNAEPNSVADHVRQSIRAYCDSKDIPLAQIIPKISNLSGVAPGTVSAFLSTSRAKPGEHQYNAKIDVMFAIAKAFYAISKDPDFRVKYNQSIQWRYFLPED